MNRFVTKSLFITFVLISLIVSGMGVAPASAAASPMIATFLSRPDGLNSGYLYGVWSFDASNVFTVGSGFYASGKQPLVYRGNGTSWTATNLPLSAEWSSGELTGVWGSSVSNVYTVGYGDNGGFNKPMLYRWNGSNWTEPTQALQLPNTNWNSGYLFGVWGSSASNVYLVGYGFDGSAIMPLVYQGSGDSWTVSTLPLPTVDWNSGRLYGVWGSGNEVYAIGDGVYDDGIQSPITLPLLYYWDGDNWNVSSPSLPDGWDSGNLRGVWGSGANDVYFVGTGSNGSASLPLIYHGSGTTWTPVTPGLPDNWNSGYLYGIWGSGADDVYIVGNGSDGSGDLPLIYHGSGENWPDTVPSMPNGWTSDYLNSVWGSEDGNDVYIGGFGLTGNTNMPLFYQSSPDELDVTAPGDVTNFATVSGSTSGSFNLSWTAPADDGSGSNPVASYLVKYSTSPFTSWSQGTLVSTGLPAPAAPGTTQTMTVSGLTPGTPYYFAIRAQDEQYNLSQNYAVINPPGAGIYDDMDPNWIWTGSWSQANTTGPYNGTDKYTNDATATASFTFEGYGFMLKYLKYTNRGNIEVWVDGVKVDTIYAYSGTLTWQAPYTKSGLTNAAHTVIFKHGGPSGSFIDIDSIQIFAAVPAGTYDDTDPAWTYTGSWTPATTTGPYNGTDRYTNNTASTASFTFIGTSFNFKYVTASNRGNIEVWVDGVKVDTINAYSSALTWLATYTKSGLTNAVHTVVFKHGGPGGYFIDIDAIQISP